MPAMVSTLARLAVLAILAAGCAPTLKPAPTATLIGGRGEAVLGREAGIRLIARTGAWRGQPFALESAVTPLLVTIENDSPHPLRIRHEMFALVAAGGRRLAARGPYEIDGSVVEPSAYPGPYWLAPSLIGFAHGRAVYAFDPVFGPFYADRFARVELPTGDMVQFALSEQTLAPGGRTSGFLYFDRLERPARQIDLTAELVDATTGQRVGAITIPFVVE